MIIAVEITPIKWGEKLTRSIRFALLVRTLVKSMLRPFIDCKKALDSVSTPILFYKLIRSGYGGKLILIKDMYLKTKSSVISLVHVADILISEYKL